MRLTLDDGKDDLRVAEVLSEGVDLALVLEDLGLLRAFLLWQVFHFSCFINYYFQI